MKFRLRNGKKELKIKIGNIVSEEYYENDTINKLESLQVKYENVTQEICTVTTCREKYAGNHDGNEYLIDIDKYGIESRYEIEVQCENEEKGYELINSIISSLGLTANEIKIKNQKLMSSLQQQNPELYKIFLEKNI